MTKTTSPLKTLFDLSGQTALVTGGSRGLGLQIAEALGGFGARMVLTARKADEVEAPVAYLSDLGAEAVAANLGKPREPERMTHQIYDWGISVEIPINKRRSLGSNSAVSQRDHQNLRH